MAKFVMVVQSAAKEGREQDYNEWYDTTHIHDICAIPGVKSGRRFEATPVAIGAPGQKYLSIYEIEADDAGAVMAEMGKRSSEGKITPTDSLDPASVALWFYQER